jgi:predicted ribosome quality control (RQC) complex YloA/Tae2 family protein
LEPPWYLASVNRSGDRPSDDEEALRRDAFVRAIGRALARIERRAGAIKTDLAKAAAARETADRARLFVASAASAPRGARVLKAVDWTTGSPEPIEMSLDPSKGATEQLAAVFRRGRRLTAGAAASLERLRATELAGDGVRQLARELEAEDVDVDDLEARALAIAPRDYARGAKTAAAPGSRRGELSARPPYRKFVGAAGKPILVGRDAARNDQLTLHVARPRDLWLHARAWTGAHVVVPLDKGASCPAELLVEAAHLAAHFSEARGEQTVEITYAPRRFVRKPRGSAPGAVVVDREKVLVLRKQDTLIRTLLASEVEL